MGLLRLVQMARGMPISYLILLGCTGQNQAATEDHLRWVRQRIRDDFSHRARLVTEYVDAIRQTDQGKYRYTIRQIAPEAESAAT